MFPFDFQIEPGLIYQNLPSENYCYFTFGVITFGILISAFLSFRHDESGNRRHEGSYLFYSGYAFCALLLIISNLLIYNYQLEKNPLFNIELWIKARLVLQTSPVFFYALFLLSQIGSKIMSDSRTRKYFKYYLYSFIVLLLTYVLISFAILSTDESKIRLGNIYHLYHILTPIYGFAGIFYFMTKLQGKFLAYAFTGISFLALGAIVSFINGEIVAIDAFMNNMTASYKVRFLLQPSLQTGIMLDVIFVSLALITNSRSFHSNDLPHVHHNQTDQSQDEFVDEAISHQTYNPFLFVQNGKDEKRINQEDIIRIENGERGIMISYIENGKEYDPSNLIDPSITPIKSARPTKKSYKKLASLMDDLDHKQFFLARKRVGGINKSPGFIISRRFILKKKFEQTSKRGYNRTSILIFLADASQITIAINNNRAFKDWYSKNRRSA
ncbi:MAG: hypothetical protein AAFP92_01790 [Bacteroidota bacterium]